MSPTLQDYGDFETAWCPGCGNFKILESLKQALVNQGLEPHQVLLVSGIGQAAKAPHYLRANVFNGLHGRSLPVATAAKLANPELTVIAQSGDGCNYGEGGNHWLAAVRRNPDITLLVHDNQVYGLTKGQASPTSQEGFVTKAQPQGYPSRPFNPVAVAVAMEAGLVARGFAGQPEHLCGLIEQALAHRGLAMVDILQPCVSFNQVNTFQWYEQRCSEIGPEHDPQDWPAAMALARTFGDTIPIGVIYRSERPTFDSHFKATEAGPLYKQGVDRQKLAAVMAGFA